MLITYLRYMPGWRITYEQPGRRVIGLATRVRPDNTELRHKDLKPMYAEGYNEGRVDRENRQWEKGQQQ